MKKVLCIRLDNMGDVLMTTPAFRAIKESAPDVSLTLLTSQSASKLVSFIPEINECIAWNTPWGKYETPEPIEPILARLKAESFDEAIIFTVYSQNPLPAALLCFQAGITRRIAYCHENPYSLLTDWLPDPDPAVSIRHEVKRQLDLVRSIGYHTTNEGLSLLIPKKEKNSVLKKLCGAGIIDSLPWIVVHAGASESIRKYPQYLMVQLLRILTFYLGFQTVVTGSSEEKEYIDNIINEVDNSSCVSLAGVLTLGELIELISLSPLIVTNNTGPAHIAAAVQTPVIDLYAKTNFQHTPWKVKHKVFYFDTVCKTCERNVCVESTHPLLAYAYPSPVEIAKTVCDFYSQTSYEKIDSAYSNL